jgi:hypothetical protein
LYGNLNQEENFDDNDCFAKESILLWYYWRPKLSWSAFAFADDRGKSTLIKRL